MNHPFYLGEQVRAIAVEALGRMRKIDGSLPRLDAQTFFLNESARFAQSVLKSSDAAERFRVTRLKLSQRAEPPRALRSGRHSPEPIVPSRTQRYRAVKSGSEEEKGGDSPSKLIDARIKELSDWRGERRWLEGGLWFGAQYMHVHVRRTARS